MKKGMIFCFCILAALLCVSCVKHAYPQALVEADSLCYTNPQAALKKLQSIRRGLDTTNTTDWMYYRFVKLKAQEKAYVPHSDLANINQLITYYEGKGDKTLLPEVYYFAGSTYFDLHDSPQALDYYHKALDLISAKSNLRLWGLAHAQIGYVMLCQGNYPTAIAHFRESYQVDSVRKDAKGMIYDLRDLGFSYSEMDNSDSALFYAHRALNLALSAKIPQMVTSARSSLANIYLDSKYKNLDSAAKYVLPMLENVRPENRSSIFSSAMTYYKLKNMPDSVVYYVKKLEKYGEIYAKYDAYCEKIEFILKRTGAATSMKEWRNLLSLKDSIDNITKTEAISKCQALYDYSQREKENTKLKLVNERNKNYLLLGCVLVFTLLVLFYAYYARNKIVKEDQKRQMAELRNILDKGTMQSLMNKEALPQVKKSEIYSVVLECINEKRNVTEKEWSILDETVNMYFSEFKIKLYRISNLSELEYRICLLLKIDISLSGIAILVHREPSALTMSRKRLFKKLFKKDGKAEELDSFIRSI